MYSPNCATATRSKREDATWRFTTVRCVSDLLTRDLGYAWQCVV
ncbi:hypothetical protein HanXRQr2_Chr11g0503841 [Helianthus annuus]|uniref:Uncharacterized protein n=1 Tax=Helianthus annuus TaxID=4232 RepID=A0A9K3HR47_HELAN|nr:hypothetical protein HanXRQr2_Chr11g0503841 [Helianthus annuus]KAJ0876184.1 hypothetical protein HanPSC8_Chr11g0485511 [Helianthus annuus]